MHISDDKDTKKLQKVWLNPHLFCFVLSYFYFLCYLCIKFVKILDL